MFGRIPLSCIEYSWILEHLSPGTPHFYDLLKRAIDIVLSAVLGIVTLVLWPFVALALKIQDGGPFLSYRTALVRTPQCQSLQIPLDAKKRQWQMASEAQADNNNKVTTIGAFYARAA